jgi:hypothetical protein
VGHVLVSSWLLPEIPLISVAADLFRLVWFSNSTWLHSLAICVVLVFLCLSLSSFVSQDGAMELGERAGVATVAPGVFAAADGKTVPTVWLLFEFVPL